MKRPTLPFGEWADEIKLNGKVLAQNPPRARESLATTTATTFDIPATCHRI